MNRLEITIAKADELIQAMNRLATALENKQADTAEAEALPADTPAPEVEEKPVTLEQVRAVLAAKSQAGKKTEVGELLQKYGAAKLTAIDPAKFADLLKDAESL